MAFFTDYVIAYRIWKGLTPAQRKALKFPWGEPHPRTIASLTAKGLWGDGGPTRSGMAVALCHFIGHPTTASKS